MAFARKVLPQRKEWPQARRGGWLAKSFHLPFENFFGDFVQAEHELGGLLARGVRREGEDTAGVPAGDERRREPAAVADLLAPLAEDGKMFSGIGRRVLFQSPRAGFIELKLHGKSAWSFQQRRGDDVRLGQNRFGGDGHLHRFHPQHGNGLAARADVGRAFDVQAQNGRLLAVFFPHGAAGSQRQDRRHQQKSVEPTRIKIHSADTKSQPANKVKTHMGKQSNKTEHKKRRKAYIKRQKAVIKTKKAAVKKKA